jgi:predicted  nucleic acid-binding Zn-ribbon protein
MKSETVGLSLSKALKVKSRLAGRFSKISSTITAYNCTVDGRRAEVDVKELDKQRSALSSALIDLKTAIYEANKGIYRTINQLAEKKGEIDFLNSLDTKHGTENTYQGTAVTYVSAIQKQEVDKRVKQLEKEVDDLQDQIDQYNATPERIRISTLVLDLAS